MKRLFIFSTFILALVSCGGQNSKKNGTFYYPVYSQVSMYTLKGKNLKWSKMLTWGDKLIPTGNIFTNTEKGRNVLYTEIKRAENMNESGYIRNTQLLKNVISRGVLLNSTIIRRDSNITKAGKKIMPPVLLYIIATNQNRQTWAKVKFFRPSKGYQVTKELIEIPWGYNYINLNDISTKDDDIDMIRALYFNMRDYNLSTNRTEEFIQNTVDNLQSIIKIFPNSSAILYVREAIGMISPDNGNEEAVTNQSDESNPLLDDSSDTNSNELLDNNDSESDNSSADSGGDNSDENL